MAPAAAMDLSDDPVAIEDHPRFQERRRRQFERLCQDFASLSVRDRINADDLNRDVILAALPIGFRDNQLRCGIQIASIVVDGGDDKASIDMLIGAVRRQQEDIAVFDTDRLVVDFDLRIDAERRPR
jgi:hypothetical protein